MSRLDKIRALGANATQRIEAATRDPQQTLQEAQANARTLFAGAATANPSSESKPQGPASNRLDALRTTGLERRGAPLTEIERLLNAPLPDWSALLAAVEGVRIQSEPRAIVAWAETQSLSSRSGLRKGGDYDMWGATGVIGLYRHPGWLDRLFGRLAAGLAKIFAPLLNLRRRFDGFLAALSARMGAAFFFLSLPLAFLGFIADTLGLFGNLLRNLPALLLSPIRLVREIIAIPFRLLAAMLSRLICTLLLVWLGPLLADDMKIETLLRRYPWLRGVILGFLRSDRPAAPTLIPTAGVSQVLRVRRRGLTGTREYVVVVEGRPLANGLGAWLSLKLKEIILPFYWERTVHMLCLPKKASEENSAVVYESFGMPCTEWP